MKNRRIVFFFPAVLASAGLLLGLLAGADAEQRKAGGPIQLVVRGDDIGSCHAANVACIHTCRRGIVRSLEVMVPAPWFNEAAKMLRDNPGIDVGVHLTLTSEWEFYKWGPLTEAPSLVDKQGHFNPMTSQRADFPRDTGFLQAGYKLQEVEKELRAQIELALEKLPNVSHLSAHMGTATCTPELRALVQRLSQEYKLPLGAPADVKHVRGFTGRSAEEKEASLVRALEKLRPGRWLIVEHPGLDCPEMRAMGHTGYWDVAADRDAVTKAFTSEKVKRVIEKRAIQLISYRDLRAD